MTAELKSQDPAKLLRGFALGALVTGAVVIAGCASGPSTGPRKPSGVYSFWPPPPDEPRVQFVTSYRYSSDVEPKAGALDELVFGTEREILPIGKPYGVDMWDGKIYVCDIVNPGVVILDLRAKQTRVMATRGVENMQQPTDIAIASDGMKYVVDRPLGRIFVFSATDQSVSSFGWPGFTPVGVAVSGRELYVPDFETQSVVVMDRFSGEKLRTIGGPSVEEGGFVRPLGIEIDDGGYVYVTDVIRGRLQKFTRDGEIVFTQGEIGDSAGNFVRPKHLGVDGEGVVYVVDAAFQNVQMFSPEGEVLMYFGSPGGHDGSMSLPAGLTVHEGDLDLFAEYIHPAFDAHRLLIVTNQFGLNKVAVYATGTLKAGKTIDDIAPSAAAVDTGLAEDGERVLPEQGEGAVPPEALEPAAPDAADGP